ncbi:MAG TPA: glycosyltransferase [Myxococcaceae bacterium]|nr:glycosyltransferase [Myxococcaceae bacterium]
MTEAQGAERPVRLVQFVRSFHIGGTEVQVLELLRGLPSTYDVRVGVLEAAGPLMGQLSELGHTPTAFPLNGSLMRVGTAGTIWRTAQWLKAQRADLVHVHDFYSTLMVVPAAKLAGCKVVVGRLDLAHWHGQLRRAVYAQATRAADHVIANADAIRSMLIREEHIPGHRISVIHNGLDIARFDQRLEEGLSAPLPETGDAPVLVHVANMSHPVKRQEDLLVALSLLREQGMRLHTFLVGDGPRRPGIVARARALGLSDVVHFLGHRQDVPAIYARAQLGVLCSAAEGLSNAVMEGMAARLPMVVTRVGGNPDLIEDGRRGRVVEPGQPEQLAAALGDILSQPQTGRRMGRAARRFVEHELSLGRMIARHDALYRRTLRRSSGREAVRLAPVRV